MFLIFAGLVYPSETLRPSIEMFRKVKSLSDYSPHEQEYRLRYNSCMYTSFIKASKVLGMKVQVYMMI